MNRGGARVEDGGELVVAFEDRVVCSHDSCAERGRGKEEKEQRHEDRLGSGGQSAVVVDEKALFVDEGGRKGRKRKDGTESVKRAVAT